ncbi:PREDICTED: dual oxidase-like [Priapulus caudatus]|uniref:NAD(P)H oxidase (H2O2-forming) n=1 Tax=Priapulus caudatus TaxID=37621 RepID=A0ABM1EA26_PRICU|nr:PREDICTED: dual oxidase-like [Priapulus caudatus]
MKEFTEINPTLNATNPEMFDKMRELYISVDDIDLYVGGMMETTRNGPGPLFRAIIRDQFYRIRDGDRFWFENKKNKLFTADEINTIRNTRLRDVILAATPIGHDEIQDDVLFWQDGDMKGCPQPKQLTEEDMEPCTGRTTHDNFDGNEASYIISCIILGIIPIICGVAAYIVVKYRVEKTATIKKDAQQKPAARTTAEERAAECMSDVSTDKFKCREWLSSFYDRKVTLRLGPGESFFVLNRKCERLRQINLNNAYNIILEINVDTQDQVVTLVRLPRDHDLVLLFSGERKRKVFLSHFNEYLKRQGKSMEVLQSELHRIYDTAETKDKRVKRLECFFREAYARAMGIKMNASVPIDPVAEDDVMRTEVTKSEFADALGMKSNSLFVERIFAVTDKDGNGQISFQEFLDMVVLFTKGTPLNKLRILFDMFDVSRDGKLGRKEFAEMIRSLVQSTQTQFARRDDADHLIDTMMTSAGLGEQAELTFDEFRCLLHQHGKHLGQIGLHLKGTKQVFVMKKLGTRTDSFKIEDGNVFHVEVKRSLIKKKWNAFITFMEDNRQKVFYLTLFYCICLALFAERYAHYCVLSENNDLRRVMGHGICVTRGAAHVMSFTFSLLLLTVCRHIITALRDTVINQYIPLDSALEFHKIVACTSAFFTAVHSVGHIINMYHVTTQPIEHLMCLFKEITFPSTFQPNFVYFLYKTVTGLTGLILVAICYILFYLRHARRTSARLQGVLADASPVHTDIRSHDRARISKDAGATSNFTTTLLVAAHLVRLRSINPHGDGRKLRSNRSAEQLATPLLSAVRPTSSPLVCKRIDVWPHRDPLLSVQREARSDACDVEAGRKFRSIRRDADVMNVSSTVNIFVSQYSPHVRSENDDGLPTFEQIFKFVREPSTLAGDETTDACLARGPPILDGHGTDRRMAPSSTGQTRQLPMFLHF